MSQNLFFVAPSAYPLGGVAVWLDYLIPGLMDKGWKVTLGLVAGQHHDVSAYCKIYPNLNNVIEIPNPTGSREGRINSLLRNIRQHQPDLVVVVNIPDTYDAVNRLRVQRYSAPRVVMAIHGFQPDLLDDIRDYGDKLDGVICTNRLTMSLAQEDAGFESERLFYAPYGVDMIDSINTGSTGSWPDGKLRIAWVGRIEQFQKRVWNLLDIVKELVRREVDFELLIAGSGPEEKSLQKAFLDNKLAQYVHFLGMVPPEEMYENVYSACDALLVTSYWETGPIIIWEAMASAVPVVSSRYIGSGQEAGLRDGDNALLFDIEDANAAVNQLIKLQDRVTYKRVVKGGLELVNGRYSKSVSVQHWNQVCSDIISLPFRTPSKQRVIPCQGKLDHLLGVGLGESVRKMLHLSHRHASAGGEWPHSYGIRGIENMDFWEKAMLKDKERISK